MSAGEVVSTLKKKSCPSVVRLVDPVTAEIKWERGPGAIPTNYPWDSVSWDNPYAADVRSEGGRVYFLVHWRMMVSGQWRNVWTLRVLDAATGASVYDHEGEGAEGTYGKLIVDPVSGDAIIRVGGGLGPASGQLTSPHRKYHEWRYNISQDPVTIDKSQGSTVDVSGVGAGSTRVWDSPPVAYLGDGLFAQRRNNFQGLTIGRAAGFRVWNFAGTVDFNTFDTQFSGLPEYLGLQFLYLDDYTGIDLFGEQNFWPVPGKLVWEAISSGSMTNAQIAAGNFLISTAEAGVTKRSFDPMEVSREQPILGANIYSNYASVSSTRICSSGGPFLDVTELISVQSGKGRYFIEPKDASELANLVADGEFYLYAGGPGVITISVGGVPIWIREPFGESGGVQAGDLIWSPESSAINKIWPYPPGGADPWGGANAQTQANFGFDTNQLGQLTRYWVGGEYRSEGGLNETAYIVKPGDSEDVGFVAETGCLAYAIFQTPDRNGTAEGAIQIDAEGILLPDRFEPIGYRDEGDMEARGHGGQELGTTLRAGQGYSDENGDGVGGLYRYGWGQVGSKTIRPYRSILIGGAEVDYAELFSSYPVCVADSVALMLYEGEFYRFTPDEGADYSPSAVSITSDVADLVPGRTVAAIKNTGQVKKRDGRIYWPFLVDNSSEHVAVIEAGTLNVLSLIRWKDFPLSSPANYRPGDEGLFLCGASLDNFDPEGEVYFKI